MGVQCASAAGLMVLSAHHMSCHETDLFPSLVCLADCGGLECWASRSRGHRCKRVRMWLKGCCAVGWCAQKSKGKASGGRGKKGATAKDADDEDFSLGLGGGAESSGSDASVGDPR